MIGTSRCGVRPTASVLFPDQDQYARYQSQDRDQDTGGAEADAEDAEDPNQNQVNGEKKHADVFGDHGAILSGAKGLSRANLLIRDLTSHYPKETGR
jgi:hypothetical protein